jgi:hypothetical protein
MTSVPRITRIATMPNRFLAQDHKPGATILLYRWTRINIGREA